MGAEIMEVPHFKRGIMEALQTTGFTTDLGPDQHILGGKCTTSINAGISAE